MPPPDRADAIRTLLAGPGVMRLLGLLDGDGEESRIVGGAVRNALLGLPVLDVDLATTATPDVVMASLKAARLRPIPTGLEHGTVTVLIDGRTFEITTLRRDVKTDGRHAIVEFGRDFDTDARRRDFTINAMSVAFDGTLHDPVGGLADLAPRRVRFIGDAHQRVREDYLRILRLFRFHASYGQGAIDRDALAAAIAGRDGLTRLSAERVQAELLKLVVARGAAASLEEMADAGLLDRILGGVPLVERFANVVEIERTLLLEPDAPRRLLALGVLVREDAARLRERFRLSNAFTRRLEEAAAILEHWHGVRDPAIAAIDEALFRAERTAVCDALVILHAESTMPAIDAAWLAAHRHARTALRPELPVSGDDFLSRGVAPGRRVGAALKRLQAQWIRAGFPRDPAVIARLVDEVAQRDQDSG